MLPRSDADIFFSAILSLQLHCSMLAEDAIKAAIRDYDTKRKATGNMAAGHIDVTQSATTGQTTATAHVGSGTA